MPRWATAKVRMMLTARDGVKDQFAEHEAELVELLAPLVPAKAQVAMAAWRRLARATAGIEEDEEPFDEASNHLSCSPTFGGRYLISGNLDPLAGARLAAQLEAEVDHAFRSGAASRDDGSTARLRRAKALGTIVDRGAMETTRHGEPRPSVHLIWDVADLLGLPADAPAEALRRRCQLPDGTPIPRSVAERLLAEGNVRDILAVYGMDGSCQILGVSDRRRLPTARQRIALEHQQQACTIAPGCEQATRWTESHHLDPFEHSRCTELDRMALACRHPTTSPTTAASHSPPPPVAPPSCSDRTAPPSPPPHRATMCTSPPPRTSAASPPRTHQSAPTSRPAGIVSPPPRATPSRRRGPPIDPTPGTYASHQGFTVTRLRAPNPLPSRTPSRFRTLAERRTEADKLRARAAAEQRAMLVALFSDAAEERRHPAA
ncbi:hypothetical protein BH10ACT1_BH10ACT1_00320 [soil metagenome]